MKKCKSFVNSSQYVYGYLLYYLLCMCILLRTLYCFEVLQNHNAVILVFHVSYYQVLVSYIHTFFKLKFIGTTLVNNTI